MRISDIFQFDSPYWETLYCRFSQLSFEDELELYEMIDMDAPGDVVDDEGIDSSTGDILLS
jgi:hypothetical protein